MRLGNILLFLKNNLSWSNLNLVSLLGYYRYISLIIMSLAYLCGPPPSPFFFKAGVCLCLLLEAYLFILIYNILNGEFWKKLIIFAETICLALILIFTGGLDSPFIWYAFNPILLAVTLLPPFFCWAMMGTFIISAASLQQFNVYGRQFSHVLWPERVYLVVIFILITFGAQFFNYFVNKLSRDAQLMERQIHHIKSLYEAVEVFSHNSDPQEIVSLFASYSRALTGAKKVIVWVETELGIADPQKKNFFAVRGPRNIFSEDSWYPYIKKVFEERQSVPEVSVRAFPAVQDHLQGTLVTVRIKSSTSVFGVLSAFYLEKKENLDKAEQTLTFLADLCAVALEKRAQESLAEKLLLVEEKDRIAGEIHDNVTQNIFGLVYGLDMLIKKESLDEAVTEQLRLLQKTAQRSLKDLRASIYCMSTRRNKQEPFIADVERYLNDLGQLNHISVKYNFQGVFSHVKSLTSNYLYRIIREASGNAIRHGNCESLEVLLKAENGTLELTIKDDGCGFFPENIRRGENSGLGILNMKELARSMGGTLSVESEPGKGTTIHCTVNTGNYKYSSLKKEERIS